ncbi:hypothetical protein EDB86DRAFT_2830462 [Lactarius hatsudake]|nr:hypothetical protein EDB86DRAFT_2830462 [Lactarius hatsudake]
MGRGSTRLPFGAPAPPSRRLRPHPSPAARPLPSACPLPRLARVPPFATCANGGGGGGACGGARPPLHALSLSPKATREWCPRAIRRVARPPPPPLVGAQGRRANECAAPLYPSPRPRLYAGATCERGRVEGTGHPPILADKPIGGGGGAEPGVPPPCSRAGATCELQAARAQKRPPPPFCACPLRSFTRAWERTRSRVRVGSGVRTPFAPAFAQNREGWGGAQTERRLRADGALGGGRWGVTRKWDETPDVGWGALVYTRGARKRRAARGWERARRPSLFARAPVRVEWELRADRCHPTWVSVQAA